MRPLADPSPPRNAQKTQPTSTDFTHRILCSYPVRAINVLKASGGSARESCLLPGYALNMGRAAQGMPTRVANARIALLDMNLQKARMQMGIQVLVNDPAELEKIRGRESDITKERIQKILDAGANVILTTKGIDDMALKYFVEAGALACRRVSKDDIKCVGHHTICHGTQTHTNVHQYELNGTYIGVSIEILLSTLVRVYTISSQVCNIRLLSYLH